LFKSLRLEFFEEILEFDGIDLMKDLINIMDYKFLQGNEILFKKKEIVNFCYILLEGNIGCYMNDINLIQRRLQKKIKRKKYKNSETENKMKNIKEISDYSTGEMIAEYSILSERLEKHSLTAIAKEDCHLLSFEKNRYRNTVCKIYFSFKSKNIL